MVKQKKYKVVKVVKTGEDAALGDQTYRYLTADEMKSLGDDSLPIDVTRDERIDSNKMVTSVDSNMLPPQHIEDTISPEHVPRDYGWRTEYITKFTPDNIDINRHPINIGFLVSFLVDARGGAMRGCRHSGVRVIVPPRCAPSPTRITCRYVRPQRTPHPPPLMEGEALSSRLLELGPVGARFLGPVIIEVPHFAALRGKEREIVILRSNNGETWKEHTVDATEEVLNEVLHESFEAEDLNQMEDMASGRITRIVTQDFPQYFAVVSRVRQEVHAIGPEGGMVSSTLVPQVQAIFPEGALTKKIKVGLQAQPIDPELTAKLLGHGVAVSPVVTVEPRRRKFHKAIRLSMPVPTAHSQGMINQYSGSAPTLRLLCSITGGASRALWEDVTGSTPLTFVNDVVSFTTTVSARFWLIDCRNIGDATKMATELYKEAIHVPFMAKFVVFAKRVDPLEARLRVFCMTDDKEDKTLEHQEHFTEVAKSRDVEVLEGKPQYIEFAGNLVPITKSGEQLQFSFRAFRENRLPFSVRVKDQHAEAVGRCLFMREAKVQKGELPQQPICILNIVLPDDIVTDTISLTDSESGKRHMYLSEFQDYYRPDPRLADMSNLLGEDWVELAHQLGLTSSEINVIKSEYPESIAKQAQSMLRMWLSQSGNKAQTNTLENALRRIGREDIIPQCLNVEQPSHTISRIKEEEIGYRLKKKEEHEVPDNKKRIIDHYDKYSAEEKAFEKSESEEEDNFDKTVGERREQIEKRLSAERVIPASSQRREIVQEITDIKRQSLVEDKLAEVLQKVEPDQKDIRRQPDGKTIISETVEIKTTLPSDSAISDKLLSPDQHTVTTTKIVETHKIVEDITTHRPGEDTRFMEEVSSRFDGPTVDHRTASIEDPKSPKFSKTPPPSPADFLLQKQAASAQKWDASKKPAEVTDRSALEQAAALQATSLNFISCEKVLVEPSRNISPDSLPITLHKTTSYTQIDAILDRMLQEVDKQEQRLFHLDLDVLEPQEQCSNTLELIPSSDALIEVPIKKSIRVPKHKPKVYETTQSIKISQTEDSPYELIAFGNSKEEMQEEEHEYDLINFEDSASKVKEDETVANEVMSVPIEGDEACLLLEYLDDNYFDKPYTSHYTLQFNKATTASVESLNDNANSYPDSLNDPKECMPDPEEHNYEPIYTQHINDFDYQLHDNFNDSSGIWWEGTYRNLSIVPEEDEENLSMLSSLYSNPNKYVSRTYPSLLGGDEHEEQEEEIPLMGSSKLSFDESSSSGTTSSDEGTYDLSEKVVKAEVKLMVKTVDKGKENIEIRSVREFIDNPKKSKKNKDVRKLKNKSQTLPSRLSEKFFNFGNKVSSFLDPVKKKSSSYDSLVVGNVQPEREESPDKPTFTLPRLFIRSQENEVFDKKGNASNLECSKELSKSKSELIATTNKKFPLECDYEYTENIHKVDLYANPPFYPIYEEFNSSQPLLTTHSNHAPNICPSPAYCDWLPESEDLSKGDEKVQPSGSQSRAPLTKVESEEVHDKTDKEKSKKVPDQHQLSDEMRELLKEMEKESQQ